MRQKLLHIGEGFWNIRGSFKIAGIDIGTHSSLIRLNDTEFVLLDVYSFDGETLAAIEEIVGDLDNIRTVINVHPFHTVHVERGFELFPTAIHYGTARHHQRFPNLDWQSQTTEMLVDDNPFAGVLEFSVPKGVEFVADNENVHFSSVLAYHTVSKTLHVDDTLMVIESPDIVKGLLSRLNADRLVQFHPTLALALKKESGAADAFKEWALDLCEGWGAELETICAAHKGVVSNNDDGSKISKKMRRALMLVEPVLVGHRLRYR